MAKRGLSNMAMTACFAGPIFNLLAALGVGFIWYLNTEHLAYAPVKLMVSWLITLMAYRSMAEGVSLPKMINDGQTVSAFSP